MVAAALKKGLLARGFKEDKQELLLRRMLFADFMAVVATESGKWGKDETDAFVFLQSRRFSQVLDRLFGLSRFRFSDYEARKAVSDKSGVLAMALAGIEMHARKPSLFSAAIHLDAKKLGALLDAMDSAGNFSRILYESELASFLSLTEGSWVYLYLAAEQGLAPDEALRGISSNVAVRSEARKWHLKKPIDIDVIEAFYAVHRATPGPAGSKSKG